MMAQKKAEKINPENEGAALDAALSVSGKGETPDAPAAYSAPQKKENAINPKALTLTGRMRSEASYAKSFIRLKPGTPLFRRMGGRAIVRASFLIRAGQHVGRVVAQGLGEELSPEEGAELESKQAAEITKARDERRKRMTAKPDDSNPKEKAVAKV